MSDDELLSTKFPTGLGLSESEDNTTSDDNDDKP